MIFFFPARGLSTTFEVDVYLDPPSFSPLPLRYLTDLTDFEALRPFFFPSLFFLVRPFRACFFFFFFCSHNKVGGGGPPEVEGVVLSPGVYFLIKC